MQPSAAAVADSVTCCCAASDELLGAAALSSPSDLEQPVAARPAVASSRQATASVRVLCLVMLTTLLGLDGGGPSVVRVVLGRRGEAGSGHPWGAALQRYIRGSPRRQEVRREFRKPADGRCPPRCSDTGGTCDDFCVSYGHDSQRVLSCRVASVFPTLKEREPQEATPHAPEPPTVRHHRTHRGRRSPTAAGRARRCRRRGRAPGSCLGPGRPRPRRPLHPQRRPAGPHRLPAAAARRGHRPRLARRPAAAATRGPVRPVRLDLALPGHGQQRLGPPGRHRLGGGAVLAARLHRPGDPHRRRHRAGRRTPLGRRDPRHRAARRLLRPDLAAHLARRRPRLLAVPAADLGAAQLAGVQRRQQDRAAADRLLPLHERPGSRRLQPELGVGALGRRPGQRLLALQPHRRRLPARPRRQDPRRRRQLGEQPAVPAQRQHRPGLPRTRAVRAALAVGRADPGRVPELHRGDDRLRAVPRRRVRRRRERQARLRRPPAGLRDLRHRGVHGQPPAADPDHRRPGVGRPLRGPGLQLAARRPRPVRQGRALHHQRQQRRPGRQRQDAGAVPEQLGHAGLSARRRPVPLLPAQLRHGLALLHRGAVARHPRPRAGGGDVRAQFRHREGRRRHPGDLHRDHRLPLRRHRHAHPERPGTAGLPAVSAHPRLVLRAPPQRQRRRRRRPRGTGLHRRRPHLEERRHRRPHPAADHDHQDLAGQPRRHRHRPRPAQLLPRHRRDLRADRRQHPVPRVRRAHRRRLELRARPRRGRHRLQPHRRPAAGRPLHPRRHPRAHHRACPPHRRVAGRQPARGQPAPGLTRPQHRTRRDRHPHPDGRSQAADLRLPHHLAHRPPVVGARALPQDQEQELRQGHRCRPDVDCQQRACGAVRRQRDRRPPVAAGRQR
ncbi:hypothetical protein SBRY_70199 [Actinacidiphila bryophytorum]|uniref:Uncharacterized protein n=1 Tax=Actinacidiphila bryophytorum TaxID=1436133 RepID=A0A9W4H786_9ACTN|nr:hypothetical protein SBRY_70199 [Actinacidiphila bryophytorum]